MADGVTAQCAQWRVWRYFSKPAQCGSRSIGVMPIYKNERAHLTAHRGSRNTPYKTACFFAPPILVISMSACNL